MEDKTENTIYELIAKSFGGETSSSERQEIDRWRGKSDNNQKEYNDLLKSWELSATYDPKLLNIDLNAEWLSFLQRTQQARKTGLGRSLDGMSCGLTDSRKNTCIR